MNIKTNKNKGMVALLILMAIFLLIFIYCISKSVNKINEKNVKDVNNKTKILLQYKNNKFMAESCYNDNYNSCSINKTINFINLKGENCVKLFNNVESLTNDNTELYLVKMIVVINDEKCKK